MCLLCIMDAKWTTCFLRRPAPKFAANCLSSSTNILPHSLIRRLSHDLRLNKDQLARELGVEPDSLDEDGFYYWCVHSPGSTVFVLVSVLINIGRTDCVELIQEYLEMHFMLLYIKVEEATVEARSPVSSPKFFQVTTSCEFTLEQALENFLGGDLVHYEIVGPGPWVNWTTLAKELKGQQLTLVYHNQPAAHMRSALYGPMETETDLKVFDTTKNTTDSDILLDDQTVVKEYDYTQIESLKFGASDLSVPSTTSDNTTLSNFLEKESKSPYIEGATEIKLFPSLNNLKSQTRTKVLMVADNNTSDFIQAEKRFPEKVFGEEMKTTSTSDIVLLEQTPNNVPRFSILERESSTFSTNNQMLSLQPAQICAPQSNQKTGLQNKEMTPCQRYYTTNKNNLNNLNTVTSSPQSSFIQNSLDSKVKKTETNLTFITAMRSENVQSLDDNADDSAMIVDDSSNLSSVSYDVNLAPVDPETAASSLFTHARNTQHINVSLCSPLAAYVPHSCIQSDPGQLAGPENNPLHCQIPDSIATPPLARHNPCGVSPLTSPEHIQTHQQYLLFEKHARELKFLQQLHKVEQQEFMNLKQNTGATINHTMTVIIDNQHQEHIQHSRPTYTTLLEPGQICNNQPSMDRPLYHSGINIQHHPQHQLLHSPGELQSLGKPSLFCHTPPPSFPEEKPQSNKNRELEVRQENLKQPELSTSYNQQNYNSAQPVKQKALLQLKDDNSEQHMDMFQTSSFATGNPGTTSTLVKQQYIVPLNKPKSVIFPNVEITVRLPQPDPNTSGQQVVLNPRNLPKSDSGSSNHSSSSGSGGALSQGMWSFNQRNEPTPPITTFQHHQTPSPHSSQSHHQVPSLHPTSSSLGSLSSQIRNSPTDRNITSRKEDLNETVATDDEGYNIIDGVHFPRSKSLPVNQWHSPATPRRAGQSLEAELLKINCWSPHENGDTIQNTMEKYRSQDGSYIIWKSRRYNKFIISVNHLKQLFHFRVEEVKHETSDRTVYYLFEGGFRSESLLDLLRHYCQESIKICVPSPGGSKTYIEHIQLRYPVRSEVKRKVNKEH